MSERLVALLVAALLLSACSGDGDGNAATPPAGTASPDVPSAEVFEEGGVSFAQPEEWEFGIVASGRGIAQGCQDDFWAAEGRSDVDGLISVTLCPSAFPWPPKGYSIEIALNNEFVARYPRSNAMSRPLVPGHMTGLEGIEILMKTSAEAARERYGFDAPAVERIYRGAMPSPDGKPDIYEVLCVAPQGVDIEAACEQVLTTLEPRPA